MNTLQGDLRGTNYKIAIVTTRFNEFINEQLLKGAVNAAKRYGVSDENLTVAYVPGAFEIPLVAKKMATSNKYNAVICLGTIIKGGTPHFDYVAAESAKGVAGVALSSEVPVIYGILTTDTIEQAIERAGTKAGNKGEDAMTAAIEMISLLRKV